MLLLSKWFTRILDEFAPSYKRLSERVDEVIADDRAQRLSDLGSLIRTRLTREGGVDEGDPLQDSGSQCCTDVVIQTFKVKV